MCLGYLVLRTNQTTDKGIIICVAMWLRVGTVFDYNLRLSHDFWQSSDEDGEVETIEITAVQCCKVLDLRCSSVLSIML